MPHNPHPDLPALLAGLRDAPADDGPRLVLADWLDEHDEPARAAFVRRQCGMAVGDDAPPPAAWAGDLPPDVQVGYHRGLMHVRASGWRLRGGRLPEELAAAWRAGWVAGLTPVQPLDGPLADLPAEFLAPLTDLDLSLVGPWNDVSVRQLADVPSLVNLHTLRLGVTNLTEAGVRGLRACPHLARLAHLEATGPYLLAAALLDRHLWAGHGRLSLRGVRLGFAELAALAFRPEADDCHSLDLSATGVTDTALAGLLGLRPFPSLRRLDLSRNNRSVRYLQAFIHFPHLPNLAHLGLGGCAVTPSAVVALARSPHRRALRMLNLRGVNLHGRPGNVLARADCLPALERLVVDAERLTANNVRLLRRRLGDALVLHEAPSAR